MPVDVNDILIFKERGMVQAQAQPSHATVGQAYTSQQAQAAQPKATVSKTKSEEEVEAARRIEEEVKEQLEKQEAEEEGYGRSTEEHANAAKSKAGRVIAGPFSVIAGAFLFADAALLAFFGYPQYALMFSQFKALGFFGFINSINYAYGTSLLNLLLLLAIGISGLLMIARLGKMYIVAGSLAVALLVSASFEYLSSNATYLAVVSAVTFFSIIAIAYSRMSAVTVAEETETEPEQVVWPRIETF
ncbi:MAG: hypothetical protein QXR85_00275 [Candidatus Micrarchaeaceae archaeon]